MRRLLPALLLFWSVPALAQDRDYCPARPGMGDTPCTVSPRRVAVELGLADWQRDDGGDAREDDVALGNLLVRIGAGERDEIDLGWTGWDHQRDRDAGSVTQTSSGGYLRLAWRHNLVHPDGSGFSAALVPFAAVPLGGDPPGAMGIEAPMSLAAGPLALNFMPEIDAVADADGHGRHAVVSGVLGLGLDLGGNVSATPEFKWLHDADPAGSATQSFAGLSLAWMPSHNLQLDIGSVAGLDRAAPDFELYAGISRRF